MADDKPRSEKIRRGARALECDEDEARWNERLKKVAKQKGEGGAHKAWRLLLTLRVEGGSRTRSTSP
jgi:hypothetical protein